MNLPCCLVDKRFPVYLGLIIVLLLQDALHAQLPGPYSPDSYKKGMDLQYRMKFDSAILFYQTCLKEISNQQDQPVKLKEVKKRIFECESGKKLTGMPRKFMVSNLGSQVNSADEDYAPVLTEDEHLLVFTSRRAEGNMNSQKTTDGKYFEDIYYSIRQSGGWTSAQNIGRPVNTPFHDSDLAMSADGRKLFLYTDEHEGDIWVSDNMDGRWTHPSPLPSPVNTPYHESSVSISPDGKEMYVASERPGGMGGSDIYWFTLDLASGKWGAAKNLGPSVNTDWDEDSPFIDYDGRTLYFSSTGHTSMGGFDIFRTQKINDQWSTAENLGYPINTAGHDSYFVSTKDGRRAYYSSVQEGGYGKEDIYLVTLPGELIRTHETPADNDRMPEKSIQKEKEHSSPRFIYFLFDSYQLTPLALQQLDQLVETIANKLVVIQIDGHTDNLGAERYNKSLSMDRAKTIKSYFETKGISPDRLQTRGFGARKPLVSNEDEKEGRELNRRAEIKVIYY